MDDFVDPTLLDLDRYAIGQPVPRTEDPVLVSGKSRFTDDVNLPGQACCVIVRSITSMSAAQSRGINARASSAVASSPTKTATSGRPLARTAARKGHGTSRVESTDRCRNR